MTTAQEHGEKLLAAIIPDRRDLRDKALRHLTVEHFTDSMHKALYTMLERYAEATGLVLTREAIADLLRHADAGKVASYQELHSLLATMDSSEADFRWSMEQLRELAAERETRSALVEAMEILTTGKDDEKGRAQKGHADARTQVMQRFAQIDHQLAMQEAPEGDMRGAGEEIFNDYLTAEAARRNGRGLGIRFGIPPLDQKVSGVHKGELVLLAGYTSEGKTSCMVQLAWSAAVEQGKNVVILTTETAHTQVRRRIISRHSCLEGFGIEGGLNSRDIRDGTLPAHHRDKLREVVDDFDRNSGYGHCYIVQVPRGATIGYCESKLLRIQRMFPIDLVEMDYLALLKPDRRRQSDREELSGTLKEAKQLATTFNDGVGVPFISPWQVSRAARQEAERVGGYTLSATSETSEASNSPDLVMSLLAPLDNTNRVCTLTMQGLKVRDGEKVGHVKVQVDYATSYFTAPGDTSGDVFGENGFLGI